MDYTDRKIIQIIRAKRDNWIASGKDKHADAARRILRALKAAGLIPKDMPDA